MTHSFSIHWVQFPHRKFTLLINKNKQFTNKQVLVTHDNVPTIYPSLGVYHAIGFCMAEETKIFQTLHFEAISGENRDQEQAGNNETKV